MIPSALAFVFGVWVLQQQSALPALLWLLAAIPLIAMVVGCRRHYPQVSHLALISLSFMAGFFWAAGGFLA